VSVATYALIDGVLLRPLPYHDQDRLAVPWQSDPGSPRFVVAPANCLDWKRDARTFADMAAIQQFRNRSMALAVRGRPEQVDGVYVTWNLLDVLGVEPVVGRRFGLRFHRPPSAR